MKADELMKAIGTLQEETIGSVLTIDSEKQLKEAKRMENRKKYGKMIAPVLAAAACVCLVVVGASAFTGKGTKAEMAKEPQPELVQIANPMMEVSSLSEMEAYLDFKIPVLEKEVSNYIVFVISGYPTMADIRYADDAQFRMSYGSGDISGIYGGTLLEEKTLHDVLVTFYQYGEKNYAVWEQLGFTFSYVGSGDIESAVSELVQTYHSMEK